MYSQPEYAGYAGVPTKNTRQQLEEIVDVLYRRKWAILFCFLLVAAWNTWRVLQEAPKYMADSIVMVELARQNTPQFSIGGSDNLFATNTRTLPGEIYVLQNSNAIAERVRRRLGGTGERGTVIFTPANRDVSNAIRISATSPDPNEAALLANLYAEEYVRLTQDASRSYMVSSREFLEEQEALRRQELREAEERVKAYLERGGLGLDHTGQGVIANLAALEAQRDNARIELEMRLSALEVTEKELNQISPQLAGRIASGTETKIRIAQEKLAALEVQKNDILLAYPGVSEAELAKRTDLASINQRISQLQSEINQLSAEFVEEVSEAGGAIGGEAGIAYVTDLRRQIVQERIQISGLQAQIGVMEARIKEYEAQVASIPSQSLELARLERSRMHAEQMHQYLVQRLQETRIAEESEPGYASILRRAVVPTEPINSDRNRKLGMGLFFGLIVGLGAALGLNKLDNKIYKPEQLRNEGYNVVGVIPNIKPLVKDDHANEEYVEQGGRRYSTSLVTLLNPMSSVAESYRHVRTYLQFCRPDRVIQTILITSPGIGEGKSTTASNLAVTMAQAGRRTLLIDADLRRPRLHTLWGVERQPGLVQMLFEDPSADHSRLFHQVTDNLCVLPAGGWKMNADEIPGFREAKKAAREEDVVINPAELLGSKRMRDLLASFRDTFDIVIIDTPPVLAATDASLLSTQADATLLVTRAAVSKEGEIKTAVEDLDSVGASVVGMLLNGFEIKMAYGQKYRYRHYTHYSKYSKYGYYTHKAS